MEDILSFYHLVSEIKLLPRKGWTKYEIKNPETDGAHTFGAMMVGWWLAHKEGLNSEKVIKIILVHELTEAITGDITPQDSAYNNKEELERKAAKAISKKISGEIRQEITDLLNEYLKGETIEARLASEAEKLDTILQAMEYEKISKRKTAKDFSNFYSKHITSRTGRELFQCLQEKML